MEITNTLTYRLLFGFEMKEREEQKILRFLHFYIYNNCNLLVPLKIWHCYFQIFLYHYWHQLKQTKDGMSGKPVSNLKFVKSTGCLKKCLIAKFDFWVPIETVCSFLWYLVLLYRIPELVYVPKEQFLWPYSAPHSP